ncbi:anti-sigma-D factor RsdA [Micromonospora sp. DT47]|uniref:anti-sigma-D factor RsdA n=1 Tax=Micromonospora sp. DT47 TaxID=3393431 RepID=UPI003CF16A66
MSERWPDGGEELDLTTVAHDDLLLDALGRGETETDADGLPAMLAAWRADVVADETDADVDGTEVLAVGTGVDRRVDRVRADTPAGPVLASARSRPLRRRALRLAAAVVAALVLATGLGVGSRTAGPSSPLWSLTKVLHPERAEVRAVEDTIDRARDAVAAGRFEEARQLIDQARRDLTRITDPADVARLRADIDAVLRDLAAAACPTWPGCATSPALPTPSPAAPTAGGPDATGTPAPRTTAPAPRPAAPAPSPTSGSHLLPSLPGLPLPPAPSPSLLPPLPGLPLPTGDLLG